MFYIFTSFKSILQKSYILSLIDELATFSHVRMGHKRAFLSSCYRMV